MLNAFNIQQGQLPGRPEYGTNIWSYAFENQTQETITNLKQEIQRVCGGDPRVFVSEIDVFPQENGILIQLLLQVVPTTDAQRLAIFFDQEQRRASYI